MSFADIMKFRPGWRRSRLSLTRTIILSNVSMTILMALVAILLMSELTWSLLVGQEKQVMYQRLGVITAMLPVDDLGSGELHHEISEQVTTPRELLIQLNCSCLSYVVETPGFTEQFSGSDLQGIDAGEFDYVTPQSGSDFLVYRHVTTLHDDRGPVDVEIIMGANLTQDEEAFAYFFGRAVLVFAVAVILLGLLKAVLVSKLLMPLRKLADEMSRISPETLALRVGHDRLPTELHILAQSQNRLLDRIEDSYDALKSYGNNVAHEIRGPISRISHEIDGVLDDADLNELGRDRVLEIATHLEDLSHLVDRVLYLAKAENGVCPVDLLPCRIDGLLHDLYDIYLPAFEEKSVRFEVGTEDGLLWVTDTLLLRQILINLIENALKFTPAGGTVSLEAQRLQGGLVLSVRDTGIGISEEMVEKVFERFVQEDAARSSRSGAGLGLSIVATLAKLLRAEVSIRSDKGAGTMVRVRFGAGS